ncbi:MAG: hypothetical protein LBR61_11960 [Synergistaceae bacterium]|jgi:hypothetical protein|nr:hypothetical protein [Synergistaceae bacterium]
MNLKNLSLRQMFHRKSPKRERSASGNLQSASSLPLEGGKVWKAWGWILPLLLGLTLGWFGMVCLEGWLEKSNRPRRSEAEAALLPAAVADTENLNMTAFLDANPFRISPRPFQEEDASGGEISGDSPAVITGDLATAVLKWPMPDVGVWIENQGKQHILLIGESFDVYTLENVGVRQALFSKGEEYVIKDLLFGATSPSGGAPGSAARRSEDSTSAASAPSGSQVVAAEPGGKEGMIEGTLVTKLLENPFEELKNVRLRPPKDGEGLQIQWINKDSILNQLGVNKGDTIRSINGIAFRNVTDITNSLNSLMNSDRFDVEVIRDGAPVSLKYVVR